MIKQRKRSAAQSQNNIATLLEHTAGDPFAVIVATVPKQDIAFVHGEPLVRLSALVIRDLEKVARESRERRGCNAPGSPCRWRPAPRRMLRTRRPSGTPRRQNSNRLFSIGRQLMAWSQDSAPRSLLKSAISEILVNPKAGGSHNREAQR